MKQSGFLNRIARPFVAIVERHYPDPFIFLIFLTAAAFLLALTLTETTFSEAAWAWGGGLSLLLSFMTQICLTLIAGHALAHTDFVQRLLKRSAQLPRSEAQCYAWVALVSGTCTFISWALGLVAGALMAKQLAKVGEERQWRLHYPLLVASAYSGFIVWHMGYSGSAPLFVATEGHALQGLVGLIPVSDTIFAPWNILTAVIILVAVALVCPHMRPSTDESIVIGQDKLKRETPLVSNPSSGLASRLNNARSLSFLLGAAVLTYLSLWFAREGLSLNLNIVNWSFLAAGLLLARSPFHYAELIARAVHTTAPILLQFPFYAAIMGLMTDTGLVSVISSWFTGFATQDTLPLWGFLSGGLINLFIPSGGAQWVVQGPVFLEAASDLGTDPALVVMSIAYGDQWSNMIQPFWAMPLLAIAGLHLREIMGYTFIIFVVSFVVFGTTILLVPQFT